MAKTNNNRSGNRSRSRSNDGSFVSMMKDKPYAAAGVAAGVAAAGAFLWSKRSQIGDAIDTGMDRVSEMKSQYWDEQGASGRDQSDIAEEALTLKETGKKSKGPRGPVAQQDIKSGIAESNQEAKAGAKAYS